MCWEHKQVQYFWQIKEVTILAVVLAVEVHLYQAAGAILVEVARRDRVVDLVGETLEVGKALVVDLRVEVVLRLYQIQRG
jgi:hypothetical protein